MTTVAVPPGARDVGSFVPSVQGLRGIAALSVLMDHFYDMPKGGVYDIPNPGFLPPLWPWLQSVINVGGHGVELFFMISGFLIPASLVRHGSLPKFFFDRVLRIMPVFVVLHLALFVIGPIIGYKFFRGIDVGSYLGIFFANLFFVQDALGLPIAQQNAWTLTYEWAFYIWFALSFAALQVGGRLLAAPLVLLGLACVLHWPITAFFCIGMLFSAVDFRINIPGRTGLVLGLICGAAMYASLVLFHPFVGLLPGFLLFGMVLARGSGIGNALGTPALQYVGKISYSLYLVHPFVLFPLQVIGLKLVAIGVDRWLLWSAFILLGLVMSLAASAISYELIEVRLRRWLDNAFRGWLFRPLGKVEHSV
ncbi:exopolysaccharide biosynthesis protein [Bradyrhizobium sp. LTSP885]|uniref:acyltransferase family protein n=1 Tax=Bradyrhizobium sp. LTSP885 TaxID=1619232 RepID=UPI0005C92807|nr:acyltransferase [Bradyrhizobium sp. LTSP885]KJC49497.1 exopolysaccharide biosynthesis protein [Bradyrhizobium sp. LTSP885]